jgi:pSer/pThr/pTyr-binding forkhead associated (FHA) protein
MLRRLMDIGLVCDQCDAFNPMQSHTCVSCHSALALGPRSSGAQSTPPPGLPRLSSPSPAACPKCGGSLAPGQRFCPSCGATLSAPPANAMTQPTPSLAQPSPAPGEAGRSKTMFFGAMQAARAKLVLIKGDGLDGVSFALAGSDHLLGRSPDCPLAFREDPFLSPVHANFRVEGAKLMVRDESSANGVFLRIREPRRLASGTTFLVGEQVLRVDLNPPETAGLGPDESGTFFYASPRRASRMRLVQLLRGGDTGLMYRVASEAVTLGRDGNDINFPNDPFISGHHAQVSCDDAGLLLTDTGSKNGTFVRVQGQTQLAHGDYVFMGQQLLRVEIV